MEESYIPLLSELTRNLGPAPRNPPGKAIYTDEDGRLIVGQALYKSGDCAIQNVYLPEGADFPEHRHNEKEWLICHEGSFRFQHLGGDSVVKAGSCRFINANEHHRVTALEDTQIIAITIPSSQEFPDV